ncbi:MAG: acyl-CoA reductase, partial [Marinirhabdus sp.]
MTLQQTISAFATLGKFLRAFSTEEKPQIPHSERPNALFYGKMRQNIATAEIKNGWFTRDNLLFAIKNWGNALTVKNLENWVAPYTIPNGGRAKTVAIIMAGNIPLVGFHDFLAVLVSGHKVLVKLSSNDTVLLPFLSELLIETAPGLKNRIAFTDKKLSGFNAVIATGSNNSARYFNYYFKKQLKLTPIRHSICAKS